MQQTAIKNICNICEVFHLFRKTNYGCLKPNYEIVLLTGTASHVYKTPFTKINYTNSKLCVSHTHTHNSTLQKNRKLNLSSVDVSSTTKLKIKENNPNKNPNAFFLSTYKKRQIVQ